MSVMARPAPEGEGKAGGGAGRATPEAVAAAALAAVSEAAVMFPPVRLIIVQTLPGATGPLVILPLFILLFAGSVAVATELRASPAVPGVAAVVAVGLGVAQARLWGSGGAAGLVVSVIVALALALRAITLAFRDWRDPADGTMAWGALLLLPEIFLAGQVQSGWPVAVAVGVPLFFVSALASRAASLRAAERATLQADRGAESSRLTARVLAGFAAVVVAALLVGGRNGPVRLLGALAFPLIAGIVSVFVWVLEQVTRPIFWLASKIHIDPKAFREVLRRLQLQAGNHAHVSLRPQGSFGTAQRLVGFLVLVLIALLLFRAIRRRMARLAGEADEETAKEAPADIRAIEPPARGRGLGKRFRRRELPADTVRRWYAEMLVALEGLGLPKPAWQTPGEYLGTVATAFPGCAPGFEALTHAYEDVRYGSAHLSSGTLSSLQEKRGEAEEALRRAGPVRAHEDTPGSHDLGPGKPAG